MVSIAGLPCELVVRGIELLSCHDLLDHAVRQAHAEDGLTEPAIVIFLKPSKQNPDIHVYPIP